MTDEFDRVRAYNGHVAGADRYLLELADDDDQTSDDRPEAVLIA